MNKMISIILLLVTMLTGKDLCAQKYSISTDLLDYIQLGTLNAEASVALSRRRSVSAGIRYNPFTFNRGDAGEQYQLRQQSYSLGLRLWPWHTLSGWWFSTKARYQEYNSGGILSEETEEGDRVGIGLYSGHTFMLAKHLNLELGLGFWSGVSFYTRYSCPSCGVTVDSGKKYFFLPDDFNLSLVYVF